MDYVMTKSELLLGSRARFAAMAIGLLGALAVVGAGLLILMVGYLVQTQVVQIRVPGLN